jgi:hypothetical protein
MRRPTGDQGVAIIEFAAVLPIAIIMIFIGFKAWTISTTVERVENAARTGARVAGQEQNPAACPAAARAALPTWLDDSRVDGGPSTLGVSCHVKAKAPLLWKGIPWDVTIDRTVTMPLG